jgi:hypothetical protein
MALRIIDGTMTLEIDNCVVTTVRSASTTQPTATTRCHDLSCQLAIAAARASICLSNSGGG